ncbi:MAG: TVP38/TMEM64 family protein [Planctomycetota bacterium]
MTDNADKDKMPPRSGKRWRLVALAVVVVALLVLGVVFRERVREVSQAFVRWTGDLGAVGAVVFGVAYALATVLMLPGSILTLGAGFLFGVLWGTAIVSIASTTGAALAFLVGRFFARDWVAAKVAGNRKFKAIDGAVGREGFKIVLLTRLSPIFPFNLLNYGYGLTGVKFRHYVLASWIGMLPGTIMFVYFGSLARSAAALAAGREKTAADYIFYGVGLVVTVAVVVLVTRVARNALKKALPESPERIEREG